MSKRRILLTNDDSHDSPLFHFAIDELAKLGELVIAVPAEEQSWKGKAMTRYGPVYVEKIIIHDHEAWSVSGTPADCVNIAIYNLLDSPPDLIVSGTNIGKNTGLSFMFSSGTVGACLEANIAGIPALALSQELTPEEYFHWSDNREFSDASKTTLANLSHQFIHTAWRELDIEAEQRPITWNVNFPYDVVENPDLIKTKLGQTFYTGCYSQRGDQYFHDLRSIDVDPNPETDEMVISSGHISATLLDLRKFGQTI